jgi:ribosomal protein L11 methyltransferase
MASPTILTRVVLDEATAKQVAAFIAETLDPDQTATALVEETDGRWAVEVNFLQRPDATVLRGLVAQVAGEAAARALTLSTVKPRDWVKASLAGLKPVAAGRFVIHGRHDRAGLPANRIAIEIEAALAFGTGHHGTTRGCLLALDTLLKRTSRRTRHAVNYVPAKRGGARILDLGTGSGVLAIAAAKALRRPVVASDIDRTAVSAAKDNARLNRAGPLIEIVHATGFTAPRIRAGAPYDLVLANILLGPLKRIAAPMRPLLARKACVVLSGLLPQQANAAIAAYRAQGLTLIGRITCENWTTLVMTRARDSARVPIGVIQRPQIRIRHPRAMTRECVDLVGSRSIA